MNLNELILRAACRREPALVFHTAAAASLGGLPDPEVLERAVVDDLLLIWSTVEAEEWINLMWYLPL